MKLALPLVLSLFAATADLTVGKIELVTLKPGSSTEILIPLKVKEGLHIQANKVSEPTLIATKIELKSVPPLEIGVPIYPPGKSYRLEGIEKELSVYDGNFEIKIPIKLPASAKPAKLEIPASLKYQACNDKICFFPKTEKITVSIQIVN